MRHLTPRTLFEGLREGFRGPSPPRLRVPRKGLWELAMLFTPSWIISRNWIPPTLYRTRRKRQKLPELPRSPYPQFSMFDQLFSNPARRELLRHISIGATNSFPLEEKDKEKSIERFLSRAVSLVFLELHEWEADVKDEKLRPKTLRINCASHRNLWAERPCNEILIPGLHMVRSIKKLASGSGDGPDYYTLPLRLAVKTPNLEALEVVFVPLGTSDGPDERRQHQALAEALDGLRGQAWWASLRQLVIDCYAMAPLNPTVNDQVCDLFSLAADGKGLMIPPTFDPLVRDILSVGSPMLEVGGLRLFCDHRDGHQNPILLYTDDLIEDNSHLGWQFQSQHAQWNPLPQDLSTSVQIVQG
ncbi:hypothetical protein CMUS01_07914 [Colletotrichum musicola]|uniref:Uncharacterized protein n=1 Tax=Colletotrichum musicola TaxID=2175873 RepID=A0A8H6KEU1_9PEZI|nr:hypothetical protein CMUS01_07914 [Colletotrichum musicola]